MAEAKWCGHDSRGNPIPHNDLPLISKRLKGQSIKNESINLGYKVNSDTITDFVLAPRYYNPEPIKFLKGLKKSHDLICIQDLVNDGFLEVTTGDEIGKLSYGTGEIPFVRTSDISNWEIKLDPKHGVSEEVYSKYQSRQDVQEGDILMVKDGTYLIGTCAFVSKYDTKILYQSHLYKLRVKHKGGISPYLLLAALSSKPVIDQIQAKRFTQDIIDTLGKRLYELILPIPKDIKKRNAVEKMVKKSIDDRIESRELARTAKVSIIDLLRI
jgi:type I restriction enzyme M protein